MPAPLSDRKEASAFGSPLFWFLARRRGLLYALCEWFREQDLPNGEQAQVASGRFGSWLTLSLCHRLWEKSGENGRFVKRLSTLLVCFFRANPSVLLFSFFVSTRTKRIYFFVYASFSEQEPYDCYSVYACKHSLSYNHFYKLWKVLLPCSAVLTGIPIYYMLFSSRKQYIL